jgi:predicted RNA-binding protein Jag
MPEEIIKIGPTVEEAVDAALEEFGVQADAAEFEVLEQPGRGATEAKVRVWLKPGYTLTPNGDESDADEADLPAELVSTATAEVPELSEEELDHIADTAVSSIQSILGSFGIEATIDEYEGDEGEIILDIVGGELGILIGRHGKRCKQWSPRLPADRSGSGSR